jgi:hypothetical protein
MVNSPWWMWVGERTLRTEGSTGTGKISSPLPAQCQTGALLIGIAFANLRRVTSALERE